MEEVVLLPCPFCGGHPVLKSEMFLGREYWKVKCPYCFAGTHSERSADEAIEEWNRRAY